MSDFVESIKLVGGITGLTSFAWNIWTALRAYLTLTMRVELPTTGKLALVKTTVANSGVTSKVISYSAVLIAPESVPLAEAIARICDRESISTSARANDKPLIKLYRNRAHTLRQNGGCTLIPLRELYEEQRVVGPGETLTHICSLDISQLRPGTSYSVRYFVFVSYAGFYVRWRFTGDGFTIPPNSDPAATKNGP
jgi:hypothetical protein